jgi:hypothetical protein
MPVQEPPKCKAAMALRKHQIQSTEPLLQFKDIKRKENTNKVTFPIKNKKKNTNYRFEQTSQENKENNHSFI